MTFHSLHITSVLAISWHIDVISALLIAHEVTPHLFNKTDSHIGWPWSSSSTPLNSNLHPGLMTMIVGLSLLLLFLVVTLVLPIHLQNLVFFCCRRHDAGDQVNYIDVGLYKTRHAIYRPEVYSTEMRRPWTSNSSSGSNHKLQKLPSTNRVIPYQIENSGEDVTIPPDSNIPLIQRFIALDSPQRRTNLLQKLDQECYHTASTNETSMGTRSFDTHDPSTFNQNYSRERPSISLPLFKFEAVDDLDSPSFMVAPCDRLRSVSCESNYDGIETTSADKSVIAPCNETKIESLMPYFASSYSKSETNIMLPRHLDCPQCVTELEQLYRLQHESRSGKPSLIVSDKSTNRSVSFADDVNSGSAKFYLPGDT